MATQNFNFNYCGEHTKLQKAHKHSHYAKTCLNRKFRKRKLLKNTIKKLSKNGTSEFAANPLFGTRPVLLSPEILKFGDLCSQVTKFFLPQFKEKLKCRMNNHRHL